MDYGCNSAHGVGFFFGNTHTHTHTPTPTQYPHMCTHDGFTMDLFKTKNLVISEVVSVFWMLE
jgi:hypothetical protein